ncbi:MAG TPA: hypothetical protein VE074_04340, partial [Jatrophihabitantaceae bacterium]|nr:hypothetical protein [Jatrophihabitantaceae bacterium]
MLVELCDPGTPLSGAMPEPDQDVVIAGLLRRLWRPAAELFRPLHEMCDQWATAFEAAPSDLD